MPEFRLTFLGAFALSGMAPCAMVSKKAQALLALLAMPPGQAHRRDKLASMLWGDRPDESARQNLRQCLTAIRRACAAGESLPIVAEGDLLRLDPTKVAIDVCEFEQALSSADPAELDRAFALYRGDLLEGLNLQGEQFEEWLIGERRRLRALATERLGRLLEHQEGSGAREQAMQTAMRLLHIEPLQEPVHRALMRLYHEAGNTAQALRQYGICEKALRRELNVEPEAATRDLRREILRSRNASARESPGGRDADRPRRADNPLPGGGEILRGVDSPTVPTDRPSVAVLPFLCESGDPEHGYLADGIAEDIIITLSGIHRIMVIARSSSFAYRGREVDAKQVGRELGVAHILEGSLREAGGRIRITAQLVDASNGVHVGPIATIGTSIKPRPSPTTSRKRSSLPSPSSLRMANKYAIGGATRCCRRPIGTLLVDTKTSRRSVVAGWPAREKTSSARSALILSSQRRMPPSALRTRRMPGSDGPVTPKILSRRPAMRR
jgi:DNA-binding SARP family transcriptional activator/TolB-like protein